MYAPLLRERLGAGKQEQQAFRKRKIWVPRSLMMKWHQSDRDIVPSFVQ